jgi:hypothetical protein
MMLALLREHHQLAWSCLGYSTVERQSMPSIVSSFAIESLLRSHLKADGFDLSPIRVNGETGVDILATRNGESIHIEVIAFKSSAPARAKDFFQAFFRAISRIQQGATRCVIALPARWSIGLPARARQYGIAWARLGNAFPELEIWCVDEECGKFKPAKWNEWLVQS